MLLKMLNIKNNRAKKKTIVPNPTNVISKYLTGRDIFIGDVCLAACGIVTSTDIF